MPRRRTSPDSLQDTAGLGLLMLQWRERYELSQAEAAELASVSRATWGAWEGRRRLIPYREYQRIAVLLSETPTAIAERRIADREWATWTPF